MAGMSGKNTKIWYENNGGSRKEMSCASNQLTVEGGEKEIVEDFDFCSGENGPSLSLGAKGRLTLNMRVRYQEADTSVYQELYNAFEDETPIKFFWCLVKDAPPGSKLWSTEGDVFMTKCPPPSPGEANSNDKVYEVHLLKTAA